MQICKGIRQGSRPAAAEGHVLREDALEGIGARALFMCCRLCIHLPGGGAKLTLHRRGEVFRAGYECGQARTASSRQEVLVAYMFETLAASINSQRNSHHHHHHAYSSRDYRRVRAMPTVYRSNEKRPPSMNSQIKCANGLLWSQRERPKFSCCISCPVIFSTHWQNREILGQPNPETKGYKR